MILEKERNKLQEDMNELDHLKELLAVRKKEVEADSIYEDTRSDVNRNSSQNMLNSNDSMIVNIPMALDQINTHVIEKSTQ